MSEEPTPIMVPEELRPLVDHAPEILDVLRSQRIALERLSGLSERDIELVRLGTAIGLGAPEATYRSHVERALKVGASVDDVWGVVMAAVTLTGIPKILAAIPAIAAGVEAST
jgi:alkylhydroperoxidase/carboxymuconolactone decarboxylase family protein YurZ